MNIFDLGYEFKIINFDEVNSITIQERLEINRFIINNSTDATVRCYVVDKEEKRRPLLLTEMMSGFGYSNSGDTAIRYSIPAESKIYFVVVGDLPTEGKIYVTLAQ